MCLTCVGSQLSINSSSASSFSGPVQLCNTQSQRMRSSCKCLPDEGRPRSRVQILACHL
uniref:Uncharacterized protein n=1 Tax=Nothobranchius furzeri TaxID=105023 RepID=A0A8C6PB28_NOTFU